MNKHWSSAHGPAGCRVLPIAGATPLSCASRGRCRCWRLWGPAVSYAAIAALVTGRGCWVIATVRQEASAS
jgi:hypothetical protein